MKRMRKILALGAILFFMSGLWGCGKATVQINDDGVVTELEVSVPRTVDTILGDAEISLEEGDEVSPSLDTKVSEALEIIISRKKTVRLTMDGDTREVSMTGGTVGDLLEQEGIVLKEKQHVNYDLKESLKDGMEIKIFYLFTVEVQCDGKTQNQETEADTVGDVLAELNIEIGEDDRVTPKATEAVKDGMKIVVQRVTFDTLTETEGIPYGTAYENDSSLTKGQEQVSREGEDGEKKITYKVTYVDGVEESRETVEETVAKEPVDRVVKVGTREEAPAAPKQPVDTPQEAPPAPPERSVVSKKAFYDCSDSTHGYYEITYSDGSVEYEEF